MLNETTTVARRGGKEAGEFRTLGIVREAVENAQREVVEPRIGSRFTHGVCRARVSEMQSRSA